MPRNRSKVIDNKCQPAKTKQQQKLKNPESNGKYWINIVCLVHPFSKTSGKCASSYRPQNPKIQIHTKDNQLLASWNGYSQTMQQPMKNNWEPPMHNKLKAKKYKRMTRSNLIQLQKNQIKFEFKFQFNSIFTSICNSSSNLQIAINHTS